MSKRVVYVFIDASNLWQAQKTKSRLLDMEKLTNYLHQRYKAEELKVFYYDAYPALGTRSYDTSGKHNFYAMLRKKLGFVVRKKELKRIYNPTSPFKDKFVEKGNMDVELSIDTVHHAPQFETAILFTGDSGFLALVKYLRARKKKVYIFSSRNNISSELLTGGDGYVDILSLVDDIWGKEIKYREQKD